MIILTQPSIKLINPIRQSKSIGYWGILWCLAEVLDDFNLSEKGMKEINIDFWWELGGGQFDTEEFDYNSKDNLVKAINDTYNISQEKNIALAIYEVCKNIGEDPIDYWNSKI